MGTTQIVLIVLSGCLIVGLAIGLLKRSWNIKRVQLQNEIYLLQKTISALRLMLDDAAFKAGTVDDKVKNKERVGMGEVSADLHKSVVSELSKEYNVLYVDSKCCKMGSNDSNDR